MLTALELVGLDHREQAAKGFCHHYLLMTKRRVFQLKTIMGDHQVHPSCPNGQLWQESVLSMPMKDCSADSLTDS